MMLKLKLQSTLATSCKELTHWKRPWCWDGSGAGGEGDDRGWDGWMASPTWWTWVWVNSWSWRWTGRPGMLRFMGSQRVGHDWATELNCTFKNSTLGKAWKQPNVRSSPSTSHCQYTWSGKNTLFGQVQLWVQILALLLTCLSFLFCKMEITWPTY